ncbi:hypothetical protein chiPu_0031259, partial [Chiloscyllium punctatum]|nr:hypothetical protein [Chiloscyllium punctatum]
LHAPLPADPHDDDGRAARRRAVDGRHRHGLGAAPTARLHHRGRLDAVADPDPLHHAGGLSLPRQARRVAHPAAAGRLRNIPAPRRGRNEDCIMNPFDKVTTGMTAEKVVVVTPEMTVGHVVPGMPAVYGTPMMILHMEMASGSAIQPFLPVGYVSVGMMVNIRHLAATPIGRTVRAIARAVGVEAKSILFEVEAWDGDRKIGDGTHRRGIVNVAEFERRFGV